MLRRYAATVATVATFAFMGSGTALDAQIPAAQQAQQLQRMQEQVQRLDQTIQRMTQIQERAQAMEQLMLQDMERVRQQGALHAQEGIQLQTQERLQQQEQLRVMSHSVASAAGDMSQAMLSLREMAQTRTQSWDREMEQQMERLRLTMQETCDQMEAGLQIMERLRERLNES
jgi:hypothetical protein